MLQSAEFELVRERVLAHEEPPVARPPGPIGDGVGSHERSPGGTPLQRAGAAAEHVLAQARQEATALLEEAAAHVSDVREQGRSEAQREVAQAQEQARQIVARAEDQANQVHAEARDAGYREASERAAAELERELAQVVALAEGIRQAKVEYLKRCEPEIVELALEIAQKVIGEELLVNADAVLVIADRVLSLAGATTHYQIGVHPEDAERLRQHLQRTARAADVEVVGDPDIDRGGCLISTAHGRLDARLPTQLANLRGALLANGGEE